MIVARAFDAARWSTELSRKSACEEQGMPEGEVFAASFWSVLLTFLQATVWSVTRMRWILGSYKLDAPPKTATVERLMTRQRVHRTWRRSPRKLSGVWVFAERPGPRPWSC